jgi:5-methylcytosine-specific restriction endonuclease McrA
MISRSRYRKNYKVRASKKTAKVSIVAKVRRTREQAYGADWDETSESIKRRDQYKCRKCGCSNRRILHVHHIIPVSQGGKTVGYNLITLCESCHSRQPRHSHLR